MAYLETKDGYILSSIYESTRDFIREAQVTFTPDGMRLYGRDNAKVILIKYYISAEKLKINGNGIYSCSLPKIVIGLDTKMTAICLSTLGVDDILKFSVDPENHPGKFNITIQNGIDGEKSCYSIVTPDISSDGISIIDDSDALISSDIRDLCNVKQYNSPVVISSTLFHEIMRDLSKTYMCEYKATDKSIEIMCDGEQLIWSADGKFVRSSVVVKRNTSIDNSNGFKLENTKGTWPVSGKYSFNLLQKISKGKSIANNLFLFLKSNYPIIIIFESIIGDYGYVVTPKDSDSDDEISTLQPHKMPHINDSINLFNTMTIERGPCKRGRKKIKGIIH
jgi:hypothetical protein